MQVQFEVSDVHVAVARADTPANISIKEYLRRLLTTALEAKRTELLMQKKQEVSKLVEDSLAKGKAFSITKDTAGFPSIDIK